MPRTAGTGRSGPIGSRTRNALREAVQGSLKHDARPDGAPLSWPITAEVARAVADECDEARRLKDGRRFLAASKELQQLLAVLLPVAADDRAGRGGEPAPDDRAAGMAGILGAGPTLGDAAES